MFSSSTTAQSSEEFGRFHPDLRALHRSVATLRRNTRSHRQAFLGVGLLIIFCAMNSAWADTPPRKGLILWLDATDTDADGDDTNEVVSGGKLARWVDKSGRGNHIEQQDESRQPTVQCDQLGGKSVVRFDGGDMLTRDKFTRFEYRDQPLHMVLVMKSRAGSSHRMPRLIEFQPVGGELSKPATVKQHGFWIGPRGDGRMRIGTHYGDEGSALSDVCDAKPHMVEVIYAGAQSWVHYLDGARDGAGLLGDRDFHGFTKAVRLAIGQQFNSDDPDTFLEGDLAEILIYDRVLSAEEQNALKSLLGQKWSLELAIHVVPRFERDVLPILTQYCHECHGSEVQESDVDLRTVTAMLRGGQAGPVISRGHPEFSDLVEQIATGKMPPNAEEALDRTQIATIRRWIEAGAPADEAIGAIRSENWISDEDRAFWAYQRLVRQPPPEVSNTRRVRTPIDAFVLARLESHGLTFAPTADATTILRRAYFDLLGLPPTPLEMEGFLADAEPAAFERLIDRLIESQHFGERWGRSWLDWSGYVDVHGKDNDFAIIKPLEGRWRYRDYVVRSFNSGKPLDRFLIEQLAGDELVDWRNADKFTPKIVELLTATGFLLCSDDDTSQNELNTPDIRHHVLQNTGEIVANNLFALTVQCAKCHDHKYEAIPQLDYYRWLANFSPIFNPQRWVTALEHGIPDVSQRQKEAMDRHNGDIDAQVAEQAKQREHVLDRYRKRLSNEKLAKLPAAIRTDVRTAVETPAGKRNQIQKYLADKLSSLIEISKAEVDGALNEEDRARVVEFDAQISSLGSEKHIYGTIQAAVEQSPPSPTFLLRRGEVTKPGVEVEAGSFSILEVDRGLGHTRMNQQASSSGRRFAIAKQVTNPESIAGALVARVFVNRVWQELFGTGIVETSDNFGVSGSRPTHPELLDWLATEFIRGDWRVKPLIKMMMMSSVYRQDSMRQETAAAEKADPSNSLLWRARLRRLPSEYVRDRVLAASGMLDRTLGGPPVPLLAQPDGKIVINMDALPTATSHLRRSLYILNRRNYHLSILTTFDQPFLTSNCTVRKPSAVVTQSLTMLNDDFIVKQADSFANRVVSEAAAATLESRVETAYQIALCRSPKEAEKRLCIALVQRHADRYKQAHVPNDEASRKALFQLCHTLLNTNEFLYVQ